MMASAIDPSSARQVSDALLLYVRGRLAEPAITFAESPEPLGRSTSSFIYSFRLLGAPAGEWSAPLVLRLLPDSEAGPGLDREAAIQAYVIEHGYSALTPLALEVSANNALGLPFTIAPRIAGGTLLDVVRRRPLSALRVIQSMADAQVALHRIPTGSCPLPYEAPLAERRIADWHQRMAPGDTDELRPALAWLEAHVSRVRDETPAICHNDFHPMNILAGPDKRLVVIDWSEAAVGDRHHDVARTTALLWFAPLLASGRAERALLLGVRGFLRRRFIAAYRRRLPVDPVRFHYWEAAHAFNGWLQLIELDRRGPDTPELQLEFVQQMRSPRVIADLRRYFWRCTRQLTAHR